MQNFLAWFKGFFSKEFLLGVGVALAFIVESGKLPDDSVILKGVLYAALVVDVLIYAFFRTKQKVAGK